MKTRDWAIAIAIAAAFCAMALAACGGSSGGSASGGNGGPAEEEEALEFAACMRGHGVEVEDPKPGKSLVIGNTDDPATKKALAACNDKLGGGQELSAEEGEEFKEGWLAFAKCVREHGVDMADPEFLGPGKVHLDRAATGSPAFEAAREACQGKTLELNGINIGG